MNKLAIPLSLFGGSTLHIIMTIRVVWNVCTYVLYSVYMYNYVYIVYSNLLV